MAEAKALKVKRKRWYPILATNIFRQAQIGEIPLDDVRKAIGRTILANLMELTNDIKKQNINMRFIVTKIEGDNLLTEVIGYEMIPASIRRLVRRGRERVDISIACSTADNVRIRIKALLVTRAMVKGSVKAALVRNLNDSLAKNVRKLRYEELVADLVSHKFQKIIHAPLNKIYPLKTCEIRMMNIAKEKRTAGEEPKNEEVIEEVKEETQDNEEEIKEEGNEEDNQEDVQEGDKKDNPEQEEGGKDAETAD